MTGFQTPEGRRSTNQFSVITVQVEDPQNQPVRNEFSAPENHIEALYNPENGFTLNHVKQRALMLARCNYGAYRVTVVIPDYNKHSIQTAEQETTLSLDNILEWGFADIETQLPVLVYAYRNIGTKSSSTNMYQADKSSYVTQVHKALSRREMGRLLVLRLSDVPDSKFSMDFSTGVAALTTATNQAVRTELYPGLPFVFPMDLDSMSVGEVLPKIQSYIGIAAAGNNPIAKAFRTFPNHLPTKQQVPGTEAGQSDNPPAPEAPDTASTEG